MEHLEQSSTAKTWSKPGQGLRPGGQGWKRTPEAVGGKVRRKHKVAFGEGERE